MRFMPLAGSLALVLLSLGVSAGGARAQTPADPQAAAAPDSQPPDLRPPVSAGYSAVQLYNSANAYARSGRTALAVLAYERGRVFAPTDPDLRSNLHRVREAAGLPDSAAGWLQEYGRFGNPNTLYWAGMAGLLVAGGCLMRALRRHGRHRARFLAGAAVGIAALAASAFNAAANLSVLSEAVVLRPASAGVSPVAGADPLFQVPAAATVRVLDRHAGFRLVRDSQGREGWVAAADLAAVIPREADPG